ncbi:MAG: type II secretion system protein [Woeseiaceae bacterium]
MGAQERRGGRGLAHSQSGFSIIELLVVVAIIGILMALYSSSLSKAMRMAKATATAEAMHQKVIASATSDELPPTAEDARDLYRQVVDTGKGEAILTELVFGVRDDREFDAYWHTLIDPRNTEEPQFEDGGSLIAKTKDGETFVLPPIHRGPRGALGAYTVGWEFLSTVLAETSTGTLGSEVFYSDGHVTYVRYPGEFPVTRLVAELSHTFVKLTE